MDSSIGSLPLILSLKDSTAPELRWASVLDQLKALDFGSSSAGAFFVLHPEKAVQLYLITLAIHSVMASRLRRAIGLYLAQHDNLQTVKSRKASGFVRSVSQLRKAERLHAQIARHLSQLRGELSPRRRASSKKSRKRISMPAANARIKAARKTETL